MVKPMHKRLSDIRLPLTVGLLLPLGAALLAAFLLPPASRALQLPTPTPAPAIVLSPESGPSGTRVLVRGYTFTPNDVVLLTWDGNVIAPTEPAQVMVNPDGQFQAAFYVPTDGAGGHAITAGTAHETASGTFTIVAATSTPLGLQTTATPAGAQPTATSAGTQPTATPVGAQPSSTPLGAQATGTPEPTVRPSPTPGPAVVLTPNQGVRGMRVLIQGYGFNANRTILLNWDGAQLTPEHPITARSDGYFEGHFLVPGNASYDVHQVVALDGTTSAGAPFTVFQPTPTATLTPSPTFTPSPTRTTGPTNTPTNTPTVTPTPSPSPTWAPLTPGSTWVPPTATYAPWPTVVTQVPTRVPSSPGVPSSPTATLAPGAPTYTPGPKPTRVPESGAGLGGPGGMILVGGAGLVLAVLLLVFRGLRAKSNL